jgi:hypothetical protein
MGFLRKTFCEQFYAHCTGAERFSRLLAAWFQKTGALACASMATEQCSRLWASLTSDFLGDVSALDRSALGQITSCVVPLIHQLEEA